MNLQPPCLSTKRLIVRLATDEDAPKILRYYSKNQAYLAPFEPHRSQHFYTEQFWREQVEKNLIEFNYKQSLRLFLFPQSQPEKIIGTANFTQFVYGAFQNCYLGYSIAEIEQGKGYMSEALRVAIAYVFEELHLHRISANYMPHNQRSGRLLKRLGFTVEGYARDYLLINGEWQDHILTSLINPKATQ
jgi:[ribosomal protein S5]-alanine N-acetyltransferase